MSHQKSTKTLGGDNKDIDAQSINIIIMGDQSIIGDGYDSKKRSINTYSSNQSKQLIK